MDKERHFVIRWPELDISIECEPLAYNRVIYDWYIDHLLPLKGRQSHCAVSGDLAHADLKIDKDLPIIPKSEIKTMRLHKAPVGFGALTCPISEAANAQVTHGRIGRCWLTYGPTTEDMELFYNFRVVDKDIEKMQKAGAAIKNAFYKTKQIITTELSVKK